LPGWLSMASHYKIMTCPPLQRRFYRPVRMLILTGLAAGLLSPAVLAFPADTPVTPGASPEARALLGYFADIYGKKIIAGQHDGWRLTNGLSEELIYITNTTGKLPALLEMDLSGYTSPRRDREHRLVQHALDWSQNRHGLVAFCWHWRAPMNEPEFYSKDTTFDIARAVTPGTPEYAAVENDFDLIAGELECLRDAHVPVLWRPLHEANGRWFWWGAGGPEPFKKLWRMMFENFAGRHQLTNLIWVFSPGAETDLAAWYPGDAFVDIVGQDHYPMDGNHASAKDVFTELCQLTRGCKLIALGENGPIPDPALLERDQAGWLFFCTWSGSILFDKTSPAQLREYYQNPRVLTLRDLPDLKTFAGPAVGKAAALAFLGAPGDVAVGGRWRMPLTVAVQDERGRTVREGTYSVTLAAELRSGAVLSGSLSVPTVNGVAEFGDVNLATRVGASDPNCRLVATAAGLPASTSAAFTVGPGDGLKWEQWNGAKDFLAPPDHRSIMNTALESPVQLATNFSARIQGWLIAPQSGEYQFGLAGAGRVELWLGTGEEVASAGKIAAVTGRTPYRKWPHASETDSAMVTLAAGHRYYFEIRQWQDRGSTQLHVRWRLPDGREERPIPACHFQISNPAKPDPAPSR